MSAVCPKEGLPLKTIAINYGIIDAHKQSKLISGFQSQKVHLSFREYLQSIGATSKVLSSKPKEDTTANDFPQRNLIGSRSRKKTVKRFNKTHGKKHSALRHVSGGKSRKGYVHTSTTHRAKGGAIRGVGGMVVRQARPISACDAAESNVEIMCSDPNANCQSHYNIGVPIPIDDSDSIKGTVAMLQHTVLLVAKHKRTVSSLFIEHVALTIKYVMEAYSFIRKNDAEAEKRAADVAKELLDQVKKWKYTFMCIAFKAGNFDKKEAMTLFGQFSEKINEHIVFAKNFADATYLEDSDVRQQAQADLLGRNLELISEYLAAITGDDDDDMEGRRDAIKKLWEGHILCTAEYVDAQMTDERAFKVAALKCLKQGSILGSAIDAFARENSHDLKTYGEEAEVKSSMRDCDHSKDEVCSKCFDNKHFDSSALLLQHEEAIGVSAAKRRRARRYIEQHGTHYRKKKHPGKGRLMKRHVILLGDKLADEHVDMADHFGETFVDFTKRIQEEPLGSKMIANAALADSIITKCFEKCGEQGDVECEDDVNKKVGTMVSGLIGALCTSLEMASIYAPDEIEHGSVEHETAMAVADRGGYDSSVNLFQEHPGARIAHAEMVHSSLNDISHFPVNGVREGDSIAAIKKQWQHVSAPLYLVNDYPELKNKVPMAAYLGESAAYQEKKRRDPSYHMMPTEIMVASVVKAQEENVGSKRANPLLKEYCCEDVSEPASHLASLFASSGIDNRDKNIISMEIGSAMIQAFEDMKDGERGETQDLRNGRCCSIKGVTPKNYYDTITSLVNYLRGTDFVSNNCPLKLEVDEHIAQSYNHVDRLITPSKPQKPVSCGRLGLVREFAATGKKNAVVVDIDNRKDARKSKVSPISSASASFGSSKKMLSLADIASDDESDGDTYGYDSDDDMHSMIRVNHHGIF